MPLVLDYPRSQLIYSLLFPCCPKFYITADQKCPQKEEWFYDDESDICYFFDKYDTRSWTSALRYCKTEVGGSLPYFDHETEFRSFVKLM